MEIWQIYCPNLTITKNAELLSLSRWHLKKFGDLKFNFWIVQLFEMMWYKIVQLKLKFGSDNWISFFYLVIWIDLEKNNSIEKSLFSTKTELLKHSLARQTWKRKLLKTMMLKMLNTKTFFNWKIFWTWAIYDY